MRRSVASSSDARPPAAPTASPREFIATFAVLFGLILTFLVLDLSLARVERNEARQHAANLFQEGRAQLDSGHPGEAADRLSAAVSLDRSNVAYALGLAQAMAAEGRAADAEQMLGGLLERAQNDGAVNLTMARLLATTHRPRDAAAFYHRAIYGRWGADSAAQRTVARFELIDLLDKQHARAELLAELLPLQSDSADSTALLARVAPLYLRAAAPNRADDAYRALIRRSPDNAAAFVRRLRAISRRRLSERSRWQASCGAAAQPRARRIRAEVPRCSSFSNGRSRGESRPRRPLTVVPARAGSVRSQARGVGVTGDEGERSPSRCALRRSRSSRFARRIAIERNGRINFEKPDSTNSPAQPRRCRAPALERRSVDRGD